MRVPAADDLFRPTAVPDQEDTDPTDHAEHAGHPVDAVGTREAPAEPVADQVVELASAKSPAAGRQPGDRGTATQPARTASGRVRHDEKMTVYVTSDELLDIEHARLELRRHHGLAVDRGRLVRAAVALALAELDERGTDSALVRRLSGG